MNFREFIFLTRAPGRKLLLGRLKDISVQNPLIKPIMYSTGLIFLFNGISAHLKIKNAVKEVQRRKEGLEKPLYELKDEERVNFPWNSENINEWYYRPVKITGRLAHYKRIMIPTTVNGDLT